jgi:hypothetical protein
METYRKHKLWEDYWYFEPINEAKLDVLRTLNYYCWKPREDDKIEIRIESYDDSKLPKANQVKAYEFAIENQERILEGIWNYYKNLVLPIYQTGSDVGEDDIAKQKSDLSKVFGVKAIEIPSVGDFDSSYFLIQFDFRYDCEHGLYLMFKNDMPIDFFSEGEKDYEAIQIYEKGLYDENKSPLKIYITKVDGKLILRGEFYFDEQIDFDLSKGAYRIFYTINNREDVRNFIVTENISSFSLAYILRNCEEK